MSLPHLTIQYVIWDAVTFELFTYTVSEEMFLSHESGSDCLVDLKLAYPDDGQRDCVITRQWINVLLFRTVDCKHPNASLIKILSLCVIIN